MSARVPDFIATLWFYWIIAATVGLIGTWLVYVGLFRDRSRGRPRCPRCWYRLDGIIDENAKDVPDFKPVTCSECGGTIKRKRKLFKTRRRLFVASLGLMLLATCWYGTLVRNRMIQLKEPFEQAIVPTTVWILALSRSEWPLDTEETFSRLHARTVYLLPQYDPHGQSIESITWWQRKLFVFSLARIARQSTNDGHKQWAINWLGDLSVDSDRAITELYGLARDGDDAQKSRVFGAATNAKERALPLLDLATKSAKDNPREAYAPMLLAAIGPVQFQNMSDENLCNMAFELARPATFWGSTREIARDIYLTEMLRRKTQFIKAFLESKAVDPTELNRTLPAASDFAKSTDLNIELLTTLRRLQGKRDPIHIKVTSTALRGTTDKLPSVAATLHSNETLTYPIAYQQGGDNRGERPGRWRFHVVDENGAVVPIRPVKISMGGLSGFGKLKSGEASNPTNLDMNAFMDPLPPGRYTVTVQYHNGQFISDMQDVSQLILCTSKPIEMVIAKEE